ncbi:ribbon-helix-helix domain-containing protein [Aquisalimonas asiatica]|uniref:Predicted DNA-binding protein, contains Ribbon-helix-helix (RHH) domain n=1 Tax=Aquisalimonas asiatica TaxID=406100 RepID=A0A1H8Q152_9GAMM|nr:ribbon-helix-helix domain-containing protein [Aquisalimonas asiatica]SEO47796.1 Predicted DNA-binding protein, contains Ribbon-helix-helix (RHH) domain [Aquisalimonas asiatica]
MCEIFVSADPHLYAHRSRSLRLHGAVTCIRLENMFWQVLEEIARRDGMSLSQLITRLYDEIVLANGDVSNFSSFLRVSCLRYLALQSDGAIPLDTNVPIRSLEPAAVLRRDRFMRTDTSRDPLQANG